MMERLCTTDTKRSYVLDSLRFLSLLVTTELVVITTTLLRRALLRDLIFITSLLFRKKIHLCFHGGDIESSTFFLDRTIGNSQVTVIRQVPTWVSP